MAVVSLVLPLSVFFFIEFSIGALMLCIVGSAFLFNVFIGIVECTLEYKVVEETEDFIESLERNSISKGSFVLGFGSVNSTQHYFYYKQHKEGYKLDNIDCDDVYIVETDNKRPQIAYDAKVYKDKSYGSSEIYDSMKIYVPVGTIKKEFKL